MSKATKDLGREETSQGREGKPGIHFSILGVKKKKWKGRSVKSFLIDCFLLGDEEGTWTGLEGMKTQRREERG